MSLLPENEFTEFEGRQYSNPQVGVDETNSFIDKFRNAQVQDTNKISADTQALGTNVPTQMGGLSGAKNYWTSRYQTPQTNSMVQDLRTTAQAQALNEVLANEQAKWKKRYQDAYNAYQKRGWDKSNNPSTTQDPTQGGVDEESGEYSAQGAITFGDEDRGTRLTIDPATGNLLNEGDDINNPTWVRQDDGSYARPTKGSSNGGTIMIDLGNLLKGYWGVSPNRYSSGGRGR